MMPQWLHVISVASLAAGFAIAILIALDEVRHPQHMWIMNLVWPICALFGTVFVLGAYLAYGQAHPHRRSHVPFAVTVGIGAAHCGSGCTLGDLIAEWLAYFYPAAAIIFGWQLLFAERMFAVWILDFILAFGFGIVFQYYAIVPNAEPVAASGHYCRPQSRHVVTHRLANRHVRFYGVCAVLSVSPDAPHVAGYRQRRVLVDDANRDDLRIYNQLSG